MVKESLYVRFDRPRHDVEGPLFGPFDYVEMVYVQTLRVSPDGDSLAMLDVDSGEWYIGSHRERILDSQWMSVTPRIEGEPFSDINIAHYIDPPLRDPSECVYKSADEWLASDECKARERAAMWISADAED